MSQDTIDVQGIEGLVGSPRVEVRLENLRRSFGSVHALDGLSLTIKPGEMVALLGPSGCGKTTALRILGGLDELDSGRVVVDGKDITGLRASRRDMGMVFQAYSLFPNMSAAQNIAYGMAQHHIAAPRRRKRVVELLELIGLSNHSDNYPHQLSGGQQQRVALARALAIEPKVLLLDEPLSALDAKVRVQLRDEIKRIQIEVGTTALFVTHDQEEALAVADRVGVMRAGQLEQIASPSELYIEPKTAFVADFVGLTNRIRGVARSGYVEVLGSRLPLLDGSATSGQVVALVRPEFVTVTSQEKGNGRVLAQSFLGATSRVQVGLADGSAIRAQVSSDELVRLVPGLPVQVAVHSNPVFAVGV